MDSTSTREHVDLAVLGRALDGPCKSTMHLLTVAKTTGTQLSRLSSHAMRWLGSGGLLSERSSCDGFAGAAAGKFCTYDGGGDWARSVGTA